MHIRRASNLRNAAPPQARPLRSVLSGVFSLGRDGGQAWQRSRATVFASPESTPSGLGEQTSERTLREGGILAAPRLRFSPQIYPRRLAKSDVRQPIKGRRRFCGVAIVTYEDTNRSGRKICTMRYLGSVAMNNSPRELTRRAEKEPIVANQLGRAPRRQCRLGYFSGGADRTDGEKTN